MSAFLEEWGRLFSVRLIAFRVGVYLKCFCCFHATDRSVRPRRMRVPRGLNPSVVLILIAALKRRATQKLSGPDG